MNVGMYGFPSYGNQFDQQMTSTLLYTMAGV